ncbi:MAG: DNA starvation/stationary phase protection protein [Dehalococcoidia bacterium]
MVAQTQTRTGTDVMECLVHAQANAIASYLNYKRYHWFTFGAHFRDLYLFFDEVAGEAFAEIDPFGERIRMLHGDPLSTPREIERAATIRMAEGKVTPRQMLEEALANERNIIEGMRRGAKVAEESGDYGTNDLFSQHVQTHGKYAWFIQEFLRKDDGMGA